LQRFSIIPGRSTRPVRRAVATDRQRSADSVEKVGFSNGLNLGTTITGEPVHPNEWFFAPPVTFADLLLG
jgi:hypothetical protein